MLSRPRGLIALGLAALSVAGCGKSGSQTEAGAGGVPGSGSGGYQETVLRVDDGVPKQKDLPAEMGGSNQLVAA